MENADFIQSNTLKPADVRRIPAFLDVVRPTSVTQ